MRMAVFDEGLKRLNDNFRIWVDTKQDNGRSCRQATPEYQFSKVLVEGEKYSVFVVTD